MIRPCVAVGCIGFPKELHVMDISREKCGHLWSAWPLRAPENAMSGPMGAEEDMLFRPYWWITQIPS